MYRFPNCIVNAEEIEYAYITEGAEDKRAIMVKFKSESETCAFIGTEEECTAELKKIMDTIYGDY
jgi:hypothetical protein